MQVFPKFFVFLTDHSKSLQNIILASVKGGQNDNYDILDNVEIADLQKTNSKIIEETNYQDYVLESNQISKNDVPILTDQYAPVFKLLDSISSKSYSMKEQSNFNRSSFFGEKANSLPIVIISLPIISITIITLVWLFSLRQIWKNNTL